MPKHRVPRATLHEDLQDICRKQGERIVDIFDDLDPDYCVVLTDYQTLETRVVQ